MKVVLAEEPLWDYVLTRRSDGHTSCEEALLVEVGKMQSISVQIILQLMGAQYDSSCWRLAPALYPCPGARPAPLRVDVGLF